MAPSKKPPDLSSDQEFPNLASTSSSLPKKRLAESPIGKPAKTKATHNSSDSANSTASLPQAQTTDSEFSDMISDHEFSDSATETQENNCADPTTWTTVKTRKGKFLPLDLNAVPIISDRRNEDCLTVLFRPTQEGSSLQEASPSQISEALLKVGPLLAIRNIRRGGIAADFSTSAKIETILSVSSLCGLTVTSYHTGSAKLSSGVIKNVHLSENTDNIMRSINENLPEGSKVINAKRLGRKDRPSKSVKLIFEGPVLPKTVLFSYMSFPVTTFVEKPLICFKCQGFGHSSRSCHGNQACLHCAEEHLSSTCPNKTKKLCKNCGGPHSTVDPSCPVHAMQKQICTLKSTKNISYASAVRSVRASYANAGPRTNQANLSKTYKRPPVAATAVRQKADASTSTSDSLTTDSSSQTESGASVSTEVDEKFMSRLTAYCVRLAFNGAQNGLSRDRVLSIVTKGLNSIFHCPIGLDSLRSDIAALSTPFRRQ